MPVGHSPLGASGAERWMACPGSVGLAQGTEDSESDFAVLGTAAHALGAECLTQRREPWQYINSIIDNKDRIWLPPREATGILVDKDMADAVQAYVHAVDELHPDRDQGNSWIERSFHCPDIHPLFFGTSDFIYHDAPARTLHVWDYKHGQGIVVEAEDNPQLKYYAIGALETLGLWNDVDTVVLHVAQPRAFHYHGPIRSWSTTVDALDEWMADKLVPAMDRAMVSGDTTPGEHCRFCPVRGYACPEALKVADELEELMDFVKREGAKALTNEQVARFLDLGEMFKIFGKAARENGFARALGGQAIPGWKTARGKADRVWKDGAEKALIAKYKDEAWEPIKLKSPAQIEALPDGKDMAKRYAFKPDGKLQLVRASDARPEQSSNTQSLFEAATKKAKQTA